MRHWLCNTHTQINFFRQAYPFFQTYVNTEHCVVWLHNSGSDLGATPDREGDLRLLSVIDGETLEEKAAETGASATTDGVEDHESLKTSAVVRQLADAVQNQINNFFANRVMA